MESFSGFAYAVLVLVAKAVVVVVELKGIVISCSEHEPLFKFGYSRSIVIGRATKRTILQHSHDGRVFHFCQSFSSYEPMSLAAWMRAFVSRTAWKWDWNIITRSCNSWAALCLTFLSKFLSSQLPRSCLPPVSCVGYYICLNKRKLVALLGLPSVPAVLPSWLEFKGKIVVGCRLNSAGGVSAFAL